ncbi:hypothetical protein ASC77_22235 [Nocardioides sp. Root1257]|uniref:hypothetical protein n=1 Tax=unclassified Nocardioides TaxID=2615069 RepID=UPI0006F3BD48|nr:MULTISPECIES: hypothetical protein [unclassified Nocardioides]KQW43016.1 hypothetical protein ASC77_22235 [Nocardioides sp. Root1257]KRC41884.1 hypothetical protein ASE24_22025 [Nocardioides sp. Root224]
MILPDGLYLIAFVAIVIVAGSFVLWFAVTGALVALSEWALSPFIPAVRRRRDDKRARRQAELDREQERRREAWRQKFPEIYNPQTTTRPVDPDEAETPAVDEWSVMIERRDRDRDH